MLSSRLSDLQNSEVEYLPLWREHRNAIIEASVDVDLFLKEHIAIKNMICSAKDLLGDALDASVIQQTVKTDLHMKLPETSPSC